MLKRVDAYECDNCYDLINTNDASMCEYEDCVTYVCPVCDGIYCDTCRKIVDDDEERYNKNNL